MFDESFEANYVCLAELFKDVLITYLLNFTNTDFLKF